MSAVKVDLTCEPCEGTGYFVCRWPGCEQRHPRKMCLECHGRGRRRPELHEWDALVADRDWFDSMLRNAMRMGHRFRAERDRLQAELDAAHDARIEAQNPGIDMDDVHRHRREARARAALDPERTQESR